MKRQPFHPKLEMFVLGLVLGLILSLWWQAAQKTGLTPEVYDEARISRESNTLTKETRDE